MAHLSRETAGEVISGNPFTSLGMVEMALKRKALKGLLPAGGTPPLASIPEGDRAMILKLEHAPVSPGASEGLGWGPRIGIANKFPGEADYAVQGPHFQKQWTRDGKGEQELLAVGS